MRHFMIHDQEIEMNPKTLLFSLLLCSLISSNFAWSSEDTKQSDSTQEVESAQDSQSTKSGGGQRVGNGGPKSQKPKTQESKEQEATP